MSKYKANGRQVVVVDGGKVVWQGEDPALGWQYAQGRGSGVVYREWRPFQPESPEVSPEAAQRRVTQAPVAQRSAPEMPLS